MDKRLVNPYCVVVVDNGQRVVTSTKHATNQPFFGEEFFFDTAITDQTSRLTIYINTQVTGTSRIRDCRLGTATTCRTESGSPRTLANDLLSLVTWRRSLVTRADAHRRGRN